MKQQQLLWFSAEVPRTPGPQESEEQLQDLCFFLCFSITPRESTMEDGGSWWVNEIPGHLKRKLTVLFFF